VTEKKPKKLIDTLALKWNTDPSKLMGTLKQTCFRLPDKNGQPQHVTDEQMQMLLVVANEHNLNPFLKELFAFPDKGGIVPIVSIDGWVNKVNSHPEFNGLEFRRSENEIKIDDDCKLCPEWMEIIIHRKDRDHPVVIREHLDEVYRPAIEKTGSNGPYKINSAWQTHTKRMLRHKTLIQGARVAFGFSGIYDEDEAHRIIEGEATVVTDADRISVGEANEIHEALTELNVKPSKFLQYFELQSIEDLPASRLEEVGVFLDQRRKLLDKPEEKPADEG
jgi:phage recombination protein Bet